MEHIGILYLGTKGYCVCSYETADPQFRGNRGVVNFEEALIGRGVSELANKKNIKILAEGINNRISISKIAAHDKVEQLRFAYFANRENFINAFSKHEVYFRDTDLGLSAITAEEFERTINEQFAFLAQLWQTGADMRGALRNGNAPHPFSVYDILGSIKIDDINGAVMVP